MKYAIALGIKYPHEFDVIMQDGTLVGFFPTISAGVITKVKNYKITSYDEVETWEKLHNQEREHIDIPWTDSRESAIKEVIAYLGLNPEDRVPLETIF